MPGHGLGPGGINPALLQHLQMQGQMGGMQRPPPMGPPPMQHQPQQQQMSSAQLMAALGLSQQGDMPQGLR